MHFKSHQIYSIYLRLYDKLKLVFGLFTEAIFFLNEVFCEKTVHCLSPLTILKAIINDCT